MDFFGRSGPPTLATVRNSKHILPAETHVTEEEQAQELNESDLGPSKPEDFASATLQGHPQFKKIVRYAR